MRELEKVVAVLYLMFWGMVWVLSKTWMYILGFVLFTTAVVVITMALT